MQGWLLNVRPGQGCGSPARDIGICWLLNVRPGQGCGSAARDIGICRAPV